MNISYLNLSIHFTKLDVFSLNNFYMNSKIESSMLLCSCKLMSLYSILIISILYLYTYISCISLEEQGPGSDVILFERKKILIGLGLHITVCVRSGLVLV